MNGERRTRRSIYPRQNPTLIELPPMQYLTITGVGNPNEENFSIAIQSLYAMSYGIRMMPKSGITPEGYYEYTVFPLEGIWSLTEEGISLQQEGKIITDLKDYLTYKVMIRQPDFVDETLMEAIREKVMQKKKDLPIDQVRFESIEEGRAVQMLHIGSYDSEPASFAIMEAYATQQGYPRKNKTHKEIYLSDPNKVEPEKQKTTLRFWV